MEKDDRIKLGRILVSAVLLAAAFFMDQQTNIPLLGKLCIYLIPYFVAGYDVILESLENIVHSITGRKYEKRCSCGCCEEDEKESAGVFDENFLMFIATVGALCIGFLPGAEPEFSEAVFVMLFFQVGELFEEIAEGKSRASITALMNIRPDAANVERDGTITEIPPDEVAVGEVIVIRPGEKIPLDGTVLEGASSVDTVALTGESVPAYVNPGDMILSGCVNLTGVLRAAVTKPFGESTVSKILDLVENAAEGKSKSETFIHKFARFYTPIVVAAAAALALFPPLLSGDFLGTFAAWLTRALSFLVISCPCALVISVPLTFFGGIGCASSRGILIKGSNYMETLADTEVMVFDKTGTLTKGIFEVTSVHPFSGDEQTLLRLSANAERYSTHPIALSLRRACDSADDCDVQEVSEIAGSGVRAVVDGQIVYVGNERLMRSCGVEFSEIRHDDGTILYVAADGTYLGYVVISDALKDDAAQAIRELKASGIAKTVLLTGDREAIAKTVTSSLGIDEYHAELLPGDKVSYVEQLIREKNPAKSLAFVGDGINDAPVLAGADVGIAMGGIGSDAAIEAADVVLMDDKPSKIALAIQISKRTIAIAKQNIVCALAIKFAVLVLVALGFASMGLAVFADVGVMVLAVCNAMRTLKMRKKKP